MVTLEKLTARVGQLTNNETILVSISPGQMTIQKKVNRVV